MEFSDISLVNNIVEQIAFGENTLNTIAGKIGEKEPTVLYSLDKLINVGLVEKRKCITDEKNKKKTRYVLRDYMFKFWYEFIPKATSVIEMGQGEIYYQKIVKPVLHSFMGSVFEEMCRYYTLMKGITGEYGCFITSVGTWWGVENITDKNGDMRAQSADIDVVALSEIDKKAVMGGHVAFWVKAKPNTFSGEKEKAKVKIHLCGGAEMEKIEAFRQEKEKKENPLLESPKTVLLIGKYDRASKYNSKNITRYLKEKNQVLTIPYNTLYFESSEEGTVADLFLKLRKYADTNKDDENSFFMREIKRATDNIVYRLVK